MMWSAFFICWFGVGAVLAMIYAMTNRIIDPATSEADLFWGHVIMLFLPPIGFLVLLNLTATYVVSNKTKDRAHERAIVDQLYARYFNLCGEMKVEPWKRDGNWPDHWDLVLRLQSAENKKAQING